LLVIAAMLLMAGGVLHALAFGSAEAALSTSAMPPFYSNSFRALWLIDSATLISLGLLLVLIAIRPASVVGWVLYFLALIPLATAALIYTFVGSFFAPHVLVTAGLFVVIAGTRWAHAPPAA
jgi:hypothetical protein